MSDVNRFELEKYEKQLKSIGRDPAGREAMRNVLGISFADEQMRDNKAIVALLVPTHRTPHPKMIEAVIAMRNHAHANGILNFPTPSTQSSVVHWNRNHQIAELIKSQKPYTHVLFVDDDMTPPADALTKLISHGKGIVAGLCTRRQDPPVPNTRVVHEDFTVSELWTMSRKLIGDDAPEGKTLTVGTGLMLISREALQACADAYFECRFEKDRWGWSEELAAAVGEGRVARFDSTADACWFRFLSPTGVHEMGEDISFCWHAAKYAGIKTYVDCSVRPGHIGDYAYGLEDFLPHMDAAKAKAHAENRSVIIDAEHDAEEIQVVG